MLSYICIVYSFLADIGIFNVSFTIRQLIGALLIVFFNYFAICVNMQNEKTKKKQENNTKVEVEFSPLELETTDASLDS